jgi:hypothetical protein
VLSEAYTNYINQLTKTIVDKSATIASSIIDARVGRDTVVVDYKDDLENVLASLPLRDTLIRFLAGNHCANKSAIIERRIGLSMLGMEAAGEAASRLEQGLLIKDSSDIRVANLYISNVLVIDTPSNSTLKFTDTVIDGKLLAMGSPFIVFKNCHIKNDIVLPENFAGTLHFIDTTFSPECRFNLLQPSSTQVILTSCLGVPADINAYIIGSTSHLDGCYKIHANGTALQLAPSANGSMLAYNTNTNTYAPLNISSLLWSKSDLRAEILKCINETLN